MRRKKIHLIVKMEKEQNKKPTYNKKKKRIGKTNFTMMRMMKVL